MNKLVKINHIDDETNEELITYLDPNAVEAIRPNLSYKEPACYVDVEKGTFTFVGFTTEQMYSLLFGNEQTPAEAEEGM